MALLPASNSAQTERRLLGRGLQADKKGVARGLLEADVVASHRIVPRKPGRSESCRTHDADKSERPRREIVIESGSQE